MLGEKVNGGPTTRDVCERARTRRKKAAACCCGCVGSSECMLPLYERRRRKTFCCLLTCTLRRGRRENEIRAGWSASSVPGRLDSSACAGVARMERSERERKGRGTFCDLSSRVLTRSRPVACVLASRRTAGPGRGGGGERGRVRETELTALEKAWTGRR